MADFQPISSEAALTHLKAWREAQGFGPTPLMLAGSGNLMLVERVLGSATRCWSLRDLGGPNYDGGQYVAAFTEMVAVEDDERRLSVVVGGYDRFYVEHREADQARKAELRRQWRDQP